MDVRTLARHFQRGGWRRYVFCLLGGWAGVLTYIFLGPAHAVYFATYEAVKHLMGGNQAGVHHPLAAGNCNIYKFFFLAKRILTFLSYQWCLCDDR
jgi:hypothetical protein